MPFADVSVIDVGDFQFAAVATAPGLDFLENRRIVHVNAGDGVIRLRLLGLLFDADDAIAGELRDAEALRVGDLLQQNLRARPAGAKRSDRVAGCSSR